MKQKASMSGRSKTVCAADVILHIENPKGSKKLLELINQFSKTSAYTINIDDRFYFYILAINNPKMKAIVTIPFMIVLKRIADTHQNTLSISLQKKCKH